MPLASSSLTVFLSSSLVSVPLWLYVASRGNKDVPKNRRILTIFLALHSIYILHNLFFNAPLNIFRSLKLPINAPSDRLRTKLLEASGANELAPHLDELVSRLSSFDARAMYARFGHDALLNCQYCRSLNDFSIYALPRPILEYVREAAVLGMVTIRGSHHERWRFYTITVLLAAFVGELYHLNTVPIIIKPPLKSMVFWHDLLWIARQALFLILPLITHLLPYSRPAIPPLIMLPSLIQRFERNVASLHGLQFLRGASARALSANNIEWWEREKCEGAWGVNDERINEMAKRLGFDSVKREDVITEAKVTADSSDSQKSAEKVSPSEESRILPLRLSARKAAQEFMKGANIMSQ